MSCGERVAGETRGLVGAMSTQTEPLRGLDIPAPVPCPLQEFAPLLREPASRPGAPEIAPFAARSAPKPNETDLSSTKSENALKD
jgi:hypothetical protein